MINNNRRPHNRRSHSVSQLEMNRILLTAAIILSDALLVSAQQALYLTQGGGLYSAAFGATPVKMFDYGTVLRVASEPATGRLYWSTSATNVADVKVFSCDLPCTDIGTAQVIHSTPRNQGYGYIGAAIQSVRLDTSGNRRLLYVHNNEPTTDSTQQNDELVVRLDLAINNLKTVIVNKTTSNLSKSEPFFERILSFAVVSGDDYAFVFAALGYSPPSFLFQLCDFGAATPCKLQTIKTWTGPGTSPGSGSISCSYYRKSTGRLYWGSQVLDLVNQSDSSSSISPTMTVQLMHDAVNKSSTSLTPSVLFSANLSSAFWSDTGCDIDVDEAAGALFFSVRNYGMVRVDLSAASPPQPWAGLPSASSLYGFALDRRAAAAAPQVRRA
jgi:hypothetical protein